MNSILEMQRYCHEMAERLSEIMVQESMLPKKTRREQINSDHRMKLLLDRAVKNSDELAELYEDRDGLKKQEVASLLKIDEFYIRYEMLKKSRRSNPNDVYVPMEQELKEILKSRDDPEAGLVQFTDEEGYGKYLDLHELHQRFINLKGADRLDYISYLSSFDHFFEIEKSNKNSAYKEYLGELLAYLEDYMSRAKPLFDLDEHKEKVLADFEKNWEEGNCPGWPKETSGALARTGAHLDLSAFSCWEELASLGLDRLKSALMAIGLKCGGTLEERAQRLFSRKGKDWNEIDPALQAKSKPGKTGQKNSESFKEIALIEAAICSLMEFLGEERVDTRDNVQRKQARSACEIGTESDDEMSVDEDAENEEDDIIYNPKNVPLGYDGKPIPYWLYHLHGLNISYNCEICGNHTYRGPKEFQRHFTEPRHANGMRLLRIPNTSHFHLVTTIEAALSLWEKMRKAKEVEIFKPDAEEECEDSSGNVISRKIFNDLKRQGLL